MPENDNRAKTVNTWILAARPRTLPAAVAPVVVGSALIAALERDETEFADLAVALAGAVHGATTASAEE